MLFISKFSLCQNIDADYIRKNLTTKSYSIDTEASAIILFEKHTIDISYEHNHIQQKEEIHKIIRILKSDATTLANVSVFYPADDINNYIFNIKGKTYKLEDHKVVEKQLPKEDRYKKSVGNNLYEVDFPMPAVKEGSIIDYSYELISHMHDLLPVWHIQEQYPKLVSEYMVYYLPRIEFTTISHTREKQEEYPSIIDAENGIHPFCHVIRTDLLNQNCMFWLRKNIDAVKKDEPYVTNLNKEMERLELQATGFASNTGEINYMNTWDKLNDAFWKNEKFDKQINNANNFLDEVVDSITKENTAETDKIRATYMYVRSKFTSRPGKLSSIKSLYDVFENKEGTPQEINMLLTAMLVHEGIDASPVISSTTNSIPLNPKFPVLDRLEYIACAVTNRDSSRIYLDATDKNNIFGSLPYYCYNGFAWILGHKGTGVTFTNDMIKDKTVVGIKIYDFNDSSAKLDIVEKIGVIQSEAMRKKYAKDDKAFQTYMDEGAHGFTSGISVIESKIENEQNPDTNLVIRYTCKLKLDKTAGTYFINSTLIRLFKENPFKSAVRKMPIEFPYKSEYKYFMTIMLPDNIEPDSLAPPLIIDFESGCMTYKRLYSYSPEAHILTFSTNYNINTTYYPNTYYESMRDFFEKIIPLNNEIITLKKIKNEIKIIHFVIHTASRCSSGYLFL